MACGFVEDRPRSFGIAVAVHGLHRNPRTAEDPAAARRTASEGASPSEIPGVRAAPAPMRAAGIDMSKTHFSG